MVSLGSLAKLLLANPCTYARVHPSRVWHVHGHVHQLLLGNPMPFALKYTLGNLLSLGASSFLVGPARQVRSPAPSLPFAPLRSPALAFSDPL